MKITDLINCCADALAEERDTAPGRGLDAPIPVSGGQRRSTVGGLHLYTFDLNEEAPLAEDLPVTLIPPAELEPTEGFIVAREGSRVLIQTFDAIGQQVPAATLVPDTSGFFDTASRRLAEMVSKADAYTLGPTERLLPWLAPEHADREETVRATASTAVLTTNWGKDLAARRGKLAVQVTDLVKNNRRLLLITPDHRRADEMLGILARAMRAGGMQYKSLLSRYEMPVQSTAAGTPLADLGFEAHVHQFYAKSHANKASLRRQYERFRELTPLLAYKAEKQRDLDEVKLLEWRLLTELSGLQGKIKEIDATLAEYDSLPLFTRLTMQTLGKNVATLNEYRTIYEQQVQGLMGELETAKHRIEELTPEAAIPRELRPEYQELKEEITRLGGTKKIRELLAAEEGTNRQAFLQNKRVVITTAARVLADPLFTKVRFDALVVDEAPLIPAAYLLAAAALVRERIILSGDTRDISSVKAWDGLGIPAIRQAFSPLSASAVSPRS
jgi:hypothetical protein